MSPNIETVLNAALHLTPEEQAELIRRLSLSRGLKKEPGKLNKLFGSFDSGDTRSADNEKIDATLADAYEDNHEFEN